MAMITFSPNCSPAKETVLHAWGTPQSDGMIRDLNTMGGYSTFAEDLPNAKPPSFSLPSGVTIRPRKACSESTGHTKSWGMYTVRCRMFNTKHTTSGCRDCPLVFTNPTTGKSARVKGILHWANAGLDLYMWPEGSAADFSNAVGWGTTLMVERYHDPGKPAKDNLALSFVHGTDTEYSQSSNRFVTNPFNAN